MVAAFGLTPAPHLKFGSGSRKELPKILEKLGNQILVVIGKSSFESSHIGVHLINELHKKFQISIVRIAGEPTPEDIDEAVREHASNRSNAVLAIGGGSVVDAGKAISAMLLLEGSIERYLEGVGDKQHPGKKIPFIAMPTTSGTGSEATKNAVITRTGLGAFKKSLRHNNFIPDYAIVDPELTLTCSPELTASIGMDAFTQLVESFLSVQANPITDSLALEGIRRMRDSLERAVFNGSDIVAREDVSLAAFLSGLTLANAGLGLVHGFAQPLGSIFEMPHGEVCGGLMHPVNKLSVQKLMDLKDKTNPAYSKYLRLGKLFNHSCKGDDERLMNSFIDKLEEWTERFSIPYLSSYGIVEDDFEKIIVNASLKNHPVTLEKEDLFRILKMRL